MYSMESYRRDINHGRLHWRDCIAYQCNLRQMYTKHALCSGCVSNSKNWIFCKQLANLWRDSVSGMANWLPFLTPKCKLGFDIFDIHESKIIRVFSIFTYASEIQHSVNGEYCWNGRGWHVCHHLVPFIEFL